LKYKKLQDFDKSIDKENMERRKQDFNHQSSQNLLEKKHMKAEYKEFLDHQRKHDNEKKVRNELD